MLSYKWLKSLFAIQVLLSLSAPPVFAEPLLTLTSSQGSILFQWKRRSCPDSFTLDTPLRAFRDDKGKIRAFATQDDNWSFIGSKLVAIRADCLPTMSQASYKGKIMGKLWIEGVYTRDGKNVYALTSEDLTGQVQKEGCRQNGKGSNCWLNEIGFAASVDRGAHFTPSKTAIAGDNLTYDSKTMGRQGYFTTSNIVKYHEQYYFIIYQEGVPNQRPGNCLFRTSDIAAASSWEVWNGREFVHRKPKKSLCAPVGEGLLSSEVRSLTYIPTKKMWIALFSGPTKPKQNGAAAVYYSVSTDLIEWTSSHILLQPSPQEAASQLFMYPALIDPESRSRNFDTIDHSSAELFIVQLFKGAAGMHALNRDLVSYPVHISN